MGSVYQSREWLAARLAGGAVDAGVPGVIAFVKEKVFPVFGQRKVVFAEGTPEFKSTGELLSKLRRFRAVASGKFSGMWAPSVLDTREKEFLRAGFSKISNWTLLIDLTLSEEELRKGLEKKSARWGVGRAEKYGLNFSLAMVKDVDSFYDLYLETTRAEGFSAENKKFVLALRDTRVSKLFVVKHKKEIVSGGLLLLDRKQKYAILNLTAASDTGREMQAMPFLYWQMMLAARAENLQEFDLGGFDPLVRPGEKIYSVNKFKQRFGGRVVEQPMFVTNKLYAALRKIHDVRRLHLP